MFAEQGNFYLVIDYYNKYSINTNNTDYIKQGIKTKKRLMSRQATI